MLVNRVSSCSWSLGLGVTRNAEALIQETMAASQSQLPQNHSLLQTVPELRQTKASVWCWNWRRRLMGVEVSLGLPRRASGVNRGLVLERKSSVVQIVYRKTPSMQ